MKNNSFLTAKKRPTQWLFLLFLALGIVDAKANNLVITNVSMVNTGTINQVQFDISWDNSWRSSVTNNYDAAWVFFKINYNGTWEHLGLTAADISIPSSNYSLPADKKGIFIFRNTDGAGTFSLTGVKVSVFVPPVAGPFELKAFGIEMVYAPTAAFNVGGGGGTNAFTSTTIASSNPTLNPGGTGSLGGQSGGYPTGETAPNANWPNGYNAFYCMKYEITQQQYVDFLNCLTRAQQISHVATDISVPSVVNRYVLTNSLTLTNSNGIRCNPTILFSPVTFYCDFDGDGAGNESNDGQWKACNFLSWGDLAAILDWSALRPMTELEFEKTCRGPLLPLSGEYAWGTATFQNFSFLLNPGTANEKPDLISSGNIAFANVTALNGVLIRAGGFAAASTSRQQSGAAYYGAMEMSGNVNERTITIGNGQGRAFTGSHGDGTLDASGFANQANWPDPTANGVVFRGGGNGAPSFLSSLGISSRYFASTTDASRHSTYGGRGVRTAP